MGAIPPWVRIQKYVTRAVYGSPAQTETEEPAGYAFIFAPPPANRQSLPLVYEGVRIDFSRLLIQWAAAALATAAAMAYFNDSDKKSLKEWFDSLNRDKPA